MPHPAGKVDVKHAHDKTTSRKVAAFIATLSDTRSKESDTSGAAIVALLQEHGHQVAGHEILREDAGPLGRSLETLLQRPDFDVLIATGGTGIAPRDVAYEVLAALYERPLPGFGELFRMLSYQEIASAAYLSRASAGVARGKVVFSLPGAQAAVRLAMQKLILPELTHLVNELHRVPGGER